MRTARRSWSDLPDVVRQAVCDVLGADVAHFAPAAGGFSAGGVVGIACTASGSARVFVKAVPAEHFAAEDSRIEARVAAGLPAAVPSPWLRLLVEAEGWILLGYDPVDGHTPPEPWQDADLAAALDMLGTMTAALTPAPPDLDVPSIADRMAGRCDTWRGLRNDGRHGPLEVSACSWSPISPRATRSDCSSSTASDGPPARTPSTRSSSRSRATGPTRRPCHPSSALPPCAAGRNAPDVRPCAGWWVGGVRVTASARRGSRGAPARECPAHRPPVRLGAESR